MKSTARRPRPRPRAARRAQEAKPTEGRIDATFTWSVTTLASLPAGEAEELLLQRGLLRDHGQRAGAFRPLGGRCLFLSGASGGATTAVGSCLLADADGDQIFERIEEAAGKGHAVITGGTGKFAGLTGEYDFDSVWYASVREGVDQGVGTKTGVWRMSGS